MTDETAKTFTLHPQLAADCETVGDTPLCRVLLSKDSRFPWVILVPRHADLTEWHDLDATDRVVLSDEIAHLSRRLKEEFGADKTNVAALGNMVPQLHIHVVMRYRDDAAWPGPIWGVGKPVPYSEDALADTVKRIRACLP